MSVVLLLVAVVVDVAWSAETCSISGNDHCRCSTAGGLTLDLRHIGLGSYPQGVESGGYTYFYTPCTLGACAMSTGAMCQDATDSDFEYILGKYTGFTWEVTNTDPDSLQFEIHYGGGDEAGGVAREAVVNFIKGSGDTKFLFDRQEALIYHFTVSGSGIAPYNSGGNSNGQSGRGDISGPIGLTLIFLSIAGLVAYFVVGGIFMYTQRGARGMEVIPNAAFWKDLPFLIKDGFFFTISPCYKKDTYSNL